MESLSFIMGLFLGAALVYFCLVRGLMAENKRLWIDNDKKQRMSRWLATEIMYALEGIKMVHRKNLYEQYHIAMAKRENWSGYNVLKAAEDAIEKKDWR